jgi:hypothetical protein
MRSGHATRSRGFLRIASAVFLAIPALTHSLLAQAAPPAAGPSLSRADIYAGYGYFRPVNSDINGYKYPTLTFGAVGSVAGYFTNHIGVQVEGNYSPNSSDDNNCAYTAQAGPILRMQRGRFLPFAHALGGGAEIGGPVGQKCSAWGWGVTGGVGLDIILPVLHNHLAVRPVQGDFLYSQINNGAPTPGLASVTGGTGNIYAYRLSGGLVLRLGSMSPTAAASPTLNCTADPGNPFPGDPVTISASVLDLNPKKKPKYIWTTTGGKISGDGATAALDTAGLTPGSYEVTGKVVEGDKQRLVASCSTAFAVRAYDPPTVACAADRAAINSGDPVAITATARSPQNRPLTYSYSTNEGVVTGNGSTAALSTAGATPGNITVTCNVADDKGHAVAATASIVVATPPPPPPLQQIRSLCSISFDRDRKRPDRVDNEAKGCLDDVALTLNRESADKLLLVGTHADKETNRNAAERAMNAAEYLTKEKGIDPGRLDVRIGPDSSRSVALMLVPPGAAINSAAAVSFDTSTVKRTGQPYGIPGAKKTTTKRKPVTRRRRRATRPSSTPPQ